MVEFTAEQIAQRAFDLNLLDERQLQEIWGSIGSRQISGDEFRQLLERRELLTNYQSERMLRGDRTGFFYGDYKVLYLVGTGTFARVYRAAHRTTGEIRAVKVLRRKFVEDEVESDRFGREGQMGATLRHPNIVPIYEVVSRNDAHFLIMDFVEGRNLREFIKIRKKFEAAEATRLMIDVAAGLSYAAERGICHRDLKMSNILVSSRGQAKLVDFGLAGGEATDDDPEAANPRTIDYAGLERATGVRKDDPRSDIYFLGCIYYHLLTGTPPIAETRDRTMRLSKTRFQSVMPISVLDPTLPRPVVAVVTKAMELVASQRFQTPAEMLADLKAAALRMNEPDPATVSESGGKVRAPAAVACASGQRSLMVVESNVELQNIFRERLKSSGYRVLVTQDPERALARFADDAKAADCVMFSTGGLGHPALEAFNRFGENTATQAIPAVLLLGEKQQDWKSQAKLDKHRVVISMPVKLRELREVLGKLLPVVNV
jgi:eukaryotic-like serine/threonine-protein kinase